MIWLDVYTCPSVFLGAANWIMQHWHTLSIQRLISNPFSICRDWSEVQRGVGKVCASPLPHSSPGSVCVWFLWRGEIDFSGMRLYRSDIGWRRRSSLHWTAPNAFLMTVFSALCIRFLYLPTHICLRLSSCSMGFDCMEQMGVSTEYFEADY